VTSEERRAALDAIASEVRVCDRCRLAAGRTRAVPGEGSPDTEVVFVGDHFNDEAIMLKVDKAIAYPPADAAVKAVAHETIVEDDLLRIVPHILVE